MKDATDNMLIVRIEQGHIYLDTPQGDWCKEEWQQTYLFDMDGDYYDPLLEEDGIQEALNSKDTYLVTIHNPYFEVEEGYWDLDWGYVNAEVYVCWDGPVDIQKLTE